MSPLFERKNIIIILDYLFIASGKQCIVGQAIDTGKQCLVGQLSGFPYSSPHETRFALLAGEAPLVPLIITRRVMATRAASGTLYFNI